MAYKTLGSLRQVGEADQSGVNRGFWTVHFDSQNLPHVPFYEIYKIVIAGATNSTFTMYVGIHQWDVSQYGVSNTWEDEGSPLHMRPGQELYFFWSNPSTDGNPPVVTVWMRYDTSLPENQSYT